MSFLRCWTVRWCFTIANSWNNAPLQPLARSWDTSASTSKVENWPAAIERLFSKPAVGSPAPYAYILRWVTRDLLSNAMLEPLIVVSPIKKITYLFKISLTCLVKAFTTLYLTFSPQITLSPLVSESADLSWNSEINLHHWTLRSLLQTI